MSHTPATAQTLSPSVFLAFKAFINQRPDLEIRNYFDPADRFNGRRSQYSDGVRAYRQELARIAKDGTAARKALALAEELPFNAQALIDASNSAFSGRVDILMREDKAAIGYTTGQYFPTEYRPAALAVLQAYIQAVRPKHVPGPSDEFFGVDDLERANERAGGHWFSRENKRFFRSRISEGLHKGQRLIWFVSSEKAGFSDPSRVFKVRVFDTVDASVDTANEGETYSSAVQAHRAAANLAKRDVFLGQHVKVADNVKCDFCGHFGTWCSGTVSA
jgi:hypothetical protein